MGVQPNSTPHDITDFNPSNTAHLTWRVHHAKVMFLGLRLPIKNFVRQKKRYQSPSQNGQTRQKMSTPCTAVQVHLRRSARLRVLRAMDCVLASI